MLRLRSCHFPSFPSVKHSLLFIHQTPRTECTSEAHSDIQGRNCQHLGFWWKPRMFWTIHHCDLNLKNQPKFLLKPLTQKPHTLKFLAIITNLVLIQPVDYFITLVKNLLFVFIINFALKFLILNSSFHVEGIGFKRILWRHLIPLLLIFSFVFLCFLNHAFNVFLAQAAFIISDGNLVLFSCALIHSRNIENAIGINIKSDFNLRNTNLKMFKSSSFLNDKYCEIFPPMFT